MTKPIRAVAYELGHYYSWNLRFSHILSAQQVSSSSSREASFKSIHNRTYKTNKTVINTSGAKYFYCESAKPKFHRQYHKFMD